MPKSVPYLAKKLEKSVTRNDLTRTTSIVSLSRFFLLGLQIDASHFHGVIDTYLRILPFLPSVEPVRKELVELMQICMNIHSGHPEKYE